LAEVDKTIHIHFAFHFRKRSCPVSLKCSGGNVQSRICVMETNKTEGKFAFFRNLSKS